MKETGYVLFGIYVLITLWLLANSLVQFYLLVQASKNKKEKKQRPLNPLPFVSIQAPVYNEKYVAEGLLHSLSELDYPKHLFEILVLDDSTDETSAILAKKAEALTKEGFQIRIISRARRTGYKAGALQESLGQCKGEFIAVFDADFRPGPSFMRQLLPLFSNEKVGLVQARWGHANKTQNFLTRTQSFLLDTYFNVEQAGRHKQNLFTNFCGTAGIWRKQSLVEAGGWDGTVLSEDLDISYRVQLKGWKIVYDENTVVPAELPSVMEAFKTQQARWTKGMAQVWRKNIADVLKSEISLSKKFHAFFHLSAAFVFPCLLLNTLLCLPLLLLRQAYPEFVALTNYAGIGGLYLIGLTFVFYYGAQGRQRDLQFSFYFPLFVLVLMAFSVQNTVAVLKGLFGKSAVFVRTPKFAESDPDGNAYVSKKLTPLHMLEIVFFVVYAGGVLLSLYLHDWFYLPLFAMMTCGLGILIFHAPFRWRDFLRQPLPKISWR